MAKGDPFEGALPASLLAYRDWNSLNDVPPDVRKTLPRYRLGEDVDETTLLNRYKQNKDRITREVYVKRKSYYINCWHINEYESSAMWDIYSRRNEGVAIVSSEKRIKKAIEKSPETVYGGKVSYADYVADNLEYELKNTFIPLVLKRQSFAYEREYRLAHVNSAVTHKDVIVPSLEEQKKQGIRFNPEPGTVVGMPRTLEEIEKLEVDPGVLINADLNILIDKIYISPIAPDWFYNIIKNVSEKYNVDAPVIKSSLSALPLM